MGSYRIIVRAPKGGVEWRGEYYRGGQYMPEAAAVDMGVIAPVRGGAPSHEDVNLTDMTDEQLDALASRIEAERQARKAASGTVRVELETETYFDSRKHGHAYVAFLKAGEAGKAERDFVRGNEREWDSGRKYYHQTWEFEAPVGTVLECRLNDGSRKNDCREWYIVTESEGLRSIDQRQARDEIKN